jgi:hypothetical protein
VPKVATNKLTVIAHPWRLGKVFEHGGKKQKVNNYEECRQFAKANGYSGIRINYE